MESIESQCAIFIDQVDKSWEDVMSNYYDPKNIHKLERLQNIWYSCQIGLIKAIDEYVTRKHHLKIYSAFRQEILGKLKEDPNYLRYLDKMLILSYKKEHLKGIFKKAIKIFEPKNNLSKPEKIDEDIIEAFLGLREVKPFRIQTNETEDIFDYMYRHSIQRPRDIFFIVSGISEKMPNERNEYLIKTLINQRSKLNFVHDYIQDLKRLMDIDFDLVYSFINKNILKRKEIVTICGEYNKKAASFYCDENCDECKGTHLFCSLYNIGLIGVVENDLFNPNRKIQRFLEPEERELIITGSKIPLSEAYLLHPVMAHVIDDWRIKRGKKFEYANIIVGHLREYPSNMLSKKDNSERSDIKERAKSKSTYIPERKVNGTYHYG